MADAQELLDIYKENRLAFHRENIPASGYTYKDYLSWGEDIRCELIDGIPYMMAAPTTRHQWMVGKIHRQVDEFLDGKPCMAFSAPVDVRLFPEDNEFDKIVVQPDVIVVCDEDKVSDERACKGAPDFVVEVASRWTKGNDFGRKKNLYEKAGVREYWVVDVDVVYKHVLLDNTYQETMYELTEDLRLDVGVLPGCAINFRHILTGPFKIAKGH